MEDTRAQEPVLLRAYQKTLCVPVSGEFPIRILSVEPGIILILLIVLEGVNGAITWFQAVAFLSKVLI
jgi:hypothetical protein